MMDVIFSQGVVPVVSYKNSRFVLTLGAYFLIDIFLSLDCRVALVTVQTLFMKQGSR